MHASTLKIIVDVGIFRKALWFTVKFVKYYVIVLNSLTDDAGFTYRC